MLGNWDSIWSSRKVPVKEELIEFLDECSYLHEDEMVLDVGCGNGASAKTIENYGYRVVGVDLSKIGVLRALAVIKPTSKLIVADATLLPIRAQSFKAAVCLGLIQQMKSNGAFNVLRGIHSALKARSRALITTRAFGCNMHVKGIVREPCVYRNAQRECETMNLNEMRYLAECKPDSVIKGHSMTLTDPKYKGQIRKYFTIGELQEQVIKAGFSRVIRIKKTILKRNGKSRDSLQMVIEK
ncbi:class I SAM-dependent methyltransferase [Microbulbifer epialgicus]|uniref:Class I SAM-dependent methyltransferase n=1 Tax=Microbulbifer epialgicus TaxID=393907 RepID=A0ABV4P163_9GAMM